MAARRWPRPVAPGQGLERPPRGPVGPAARRCAAAPGGCSPQPGQRGPGADGRVLHGHGRLPVRRGARPAPGQALGQRVGQPRLRQPDLRQRRRQHLGAEQPAEPAHGMAQRPRGRHARRMVPAAGPAHAGRLERHALRLGRGWRDVPHRARPGLHRHQPPARRPGSLGALVRGHRDRGETGAHHGHQPRHAQGAPAHRRHGRVDDGGKARGPRDGGNRALPGPSARPGAGGAAVHPDRGRGRLGRWNGLLLRSPRPCERQKPRQPGLDLRPQRVLRHPGAVAAPGPAGPARRLRAGPLRGAVAPRHAAPRRDHRAGLPDRLRAQPRGRAGADGASRPRTRHPARASRPPVLGLAARRHPGPHARPAAGRDGEPLAAVPDPVLAAVGQGGLLPGRRRDRLPRPVAGRHGLRLGGSLAAARADPAVRLAPVPGGRRAALVACAGRRGRAHPLLRRSAVAALRLRALPACHGRPGHPARGRAVPRCRAPARRRRGRLRDAPGQRNLGLGVRARRACHRPQPGRGRARPAPDRHGRLERRHEPGGP